MNARAKRFHEKMRAALEACECDECDARREHSMLLEDVAAAARFAQQANREFDRVATGTVRYADAVRYLNVALEDLDLAVGRLDRQLVVCPECDGDPRIDDGSGMLCSACKGTGWVVRRAPEKRPLLTSEPCDCGGTPPCSHSTVKPA